MVKHLRGDQRVNIEAKTSPSGSERLFEETSLIFLDFEKAVLHAVAECGAPRIVPWFRLEVMRFDPPLLQEIDGFARDLLFTMILRAKENVPSRCSCA
jgi:hypothetical protein